MTVIRYTTKQRSMERAAGLQERCRMIMKAYGGHAAFSKRFNIPFTAVRTWKKIPYTVAPLIHNDRPRIFTAIFCRPDLKWNNKGELQGSFRDGQRKKVYS